MAGRPPNDEANAWPVGAGAGPDPEDDMEPTKDFVKKYLKFMQSITKDLRALEENINDNNLRRGVEQQIQSMLNDADFEELDPEDYEAFKGKMQGNANLSNKDFLSRVDTELERLTEQLMYLGTRAGMTIREMVRGGRRRKTRRNKKSRRRLHSRRR